MGDYPAARRSLFGFGTKRTREGIRREWCAYLICYDAPSCAARLSDANGSFEVDRKGVSLPLLLKGSYMGMEDVYHTIAKESEIELRMHPLTSQLEEVTITAHRPSHTLVNGGISTTIEGTTLAQLPNI